MELGNEIQLERQKLLFSVTSASACIGFMKIILGVVS